MSHPEGKALNLTLPVATVAAIVIAVIGWASSYFGNQYAQAQATQATNNRVSLVEQRLTTQEQTTGKLADTVDKINDNVVRLLIKNNIEPVR